MASPRPQTRLPRRLASAALLAPWVLAATALGCVQASEPKDADALPAEVNVTGLHGLVAGETLTLTAATVNATDTGYTWAVLDDTVATVDDMGVVTGVAPGETTITATGLESEAVGRHALVVVPDPSELPPAIRITGPHGIEEGTTATLTAETDYGDDSAYTWTSLDPNVVAVDSETGVVTAVGIGETSVRAAGVDTGAEARHAIVVLPAPDAPGPVIPYYDMWANSAHADRSAAAFNNWNTNDPPVVPTGCARCHSDGGFRDYIGEDGSEFGVVDEPAPIGTTLVCGTCHNAAAAELDNVTFPSGVTVGGLGPEARCMTCHQGRSSTDTVNAAITAAALPNEDTPSSELSFMNIHYYAAGATLFAGRVRGGYQYDGRVYDWRFRHVEGFNTCVGCHDPHSLEVRTDACVDCHAGVSTAADARNIRMMASIGHDYDGDGNTTEGIYHEINGLKVRLFAAIRAYTVGEGFGAVCYSSENYPYWFVDTNEDGTCDAAEAVFGNRYASWSPRLVRAAYNYQVSLKDPGAFAHNAKYLIQLLHDSIADLADALGQPTLLGPSVRTDSGHFNGASGAVRRWDNNEAVNASCSQCHGGKEGLHFYLEYGVPKQGIEQANGLECETCHIDIGGSYDLIDVPSVRFPSGVTLASDDSSSNLCASCHMGRESRATIDAAIANGQLSFRNVHYLPAAAVKAGTAAKVGYEYGGKVYAGQWVGHPGGDSCNSCHSAKNTDHSFRAEDNLDSCVLCHQDATSLGDIRTQAQRNVDYDGDGVIDEPLADEISDLAEALMTRMHTLAAATSGTGICYDAQRYPYFFLDTNGNGQCDGAAEAFSANGFKPWTPALMKAAHNYQIAQKDPGAWSHNFDYMVQLLIDSIEDLGGDVSGFVRP